METHSGTGFDDMMYSRKICTGDKYQIDDSLQSFPSGHTTAAFAGFVYLFLYLNAKLKVWSDQHSAHWKLVLTYLPIFGAVLVGGTLMADDYHHYHDVVGGATIGSVMAFSSFRIVYASLFDSRFNHIPLARDVPFDFSSGQLAES